MIQALRATSTACLRSLVSVRRDSARLGSVAPVDDADRGFTFSAHVSTCDVRKGKSAALSPSFRSDFRRCSPNTRRAEGRGSPARSRIAGVASLLAQRDLVGAIRARWALEAGRRFARI